MVAAAALFAGSATLAICANLTPRQEQVGSWYTPGGTGPGRTQSWYEHRRNRYAGLALRQIQPDITQEKQSEANDPQQGGATGWKEAVTPLTGDPLNAVTILNGVLFFCVCERRLLHNAYAAPAYRSTPPLALPREAIRTSPRRRSMVGTCESEPAGRPTRLQESLAVPVVSVAVVISIVSAIPGAQTNRNTRSRVAVAARNPASAARVAISVAANRVIVADLLDGALRGLHTARDRWCSACNHTGAEREAAGDDKAGEWAFHTFSDHCFSLRTRCLVERGLSAWVPRTKKKGCVER
jgi:hypothetical protein